MLNNTERMRREKKVIVEKFVIIYTFGFGVCCIWAGHGGDFEFVRAQNRTKSDINEIFETEFFFEKSVWAKRVSQAGSML